MKSRSRRRKKKGAQVTVRGVPPHVAEGLRRKARREGRSLNSVMVEALSREFEKPGPIVHHDLDSFFGTWQEDPEFDAIIEAQDQIDESLWSHLPTESFGEVFAEEAFIRAHDTTDASIPETDLFAGLR